MSKRESENSQILERKRAACDAIVERAAEMMVSEAGASISMMLDRILTYVGAQSCSMIGSPATADTFRQLAQNIEVGCFHSVTGEDVPRGRMN